MHTTISASDTLNLTTLQSRHFPRFSICQDEETGDRRAEVICAKRSDGERASAEVQANSLNNSDLLGPLKWDLTPRSCLLLVTLFWSRGPQPTSRSPATKAALTAPDHVTPPCYTSPSTPWAVLSLSQHILARTQALESKIWVQILAALHSCATLGMIPNQLPSLYTGIPTCTPESGEG